jgi:parvulin-like peptidyl-prolyl isomerase
VRQELLYQAALARGLHQQERLKTLLAQMRRDLLVAALLDAEFQDRELAFSEAAIRRYHDEHQADFRRPHPEIKARHILLTSEREANARRQTLLQRGESFAEVARKYSHDASTRNKGGELGYFSATENPVLWAACQDLPLKRISDPIYTEYGYHLIQILERCEAGTVRDLTQVRSQIVEALVIEHHQSQLDQLVAKLKNSTDWAIAAPTPP